MKAAWFRRVRSLGWVALACGLVAAPAGAAPAAAAKPKFMSVAEFAACTDRWSADECIEALHTYVQARPDQAFEAGKAVTLNVTHWAAIPFFDTALAAKADAARCKD